MPNNSIFASLNGGTPTSTKVTRYLSRENKKIDYNTIYRESQSKGWHLQLRFNHSDKLELVFSKADTPKRVIQVPNLKQLKEKAMNFLNN